MKCDSAKESISWPPHGHHYLRSSISSGIPTFTTVYCTVYSVYQKKSRFLELVAVNPNKANLLCFLYSVGVLTERFTLLGEIYFLAAVHILLPAYIKSLHILHQSSLKNISVKQKERLSFLFL
jgi:hypothetical protein